MKRCLVYEYSSYVFMKVGFEMPFENIELKCKGESFFSLVKLKVTENVIQLEKKDPESVNFPIILHPTSVQKILEMDSNGTLMQKVFLRHYPWTIGNSLTSDYYPDGNNELIICCKTI